MKIKRESVKLKRGSMARTPSTVPNNVQGAPHGVCWVRNVPKGCRRGVPDAERDRKAFVLTLTAQLARENKFVVAAHWM
jgi:hypothetical protein